MPPFWGRPGKRRPVDGGDGLRATERDVAGIGVRPKSTFQIGGAGAVGTGSLRGMPILHRLRDEGFAIWPFTEAGEHTLVEIYPRLLTGAVTKSRERDRRGYLDRFPGLAPSMRNAAASCEDAFDAAVSALQMWKHRHELRGLRRAEHRTHLREGLIWTPSPAHSAVTKTLVSIDPRTLEPSPIARFTLAYGRVSAEYHSQGMGDDISFMVVVGRRSRELRARDGQIFFDNLELGFANSSFLAVETVDGPER